METCEDAPYKILVDVIPKNLKSRNYCHHDKKGWVKLWFYRPKRKPAVVNECSSFKSYRRDTFYKVQGMSERDSVFDYYKLIKPTIADDVTSIGVEVCCKKKRTAPLKKYEYDEQDRIVLNWD